jgi:hypothetical protein
LSVPRLSRKDIARAFDVPLWLIDPSVPIPRRVRLRRLLRVVLRRSTLVAYRTADGRTYAPEDVEEVRVRG